MLPRASSTFRNGAPHHIHLKRTEERGKNQGSHPLTTLPNFAQWRILCTLYIPVPHKGGLRIHYTFQYPTANRESCPEIRCKGPHAQRVHLSP
eukprot:jgi/Botrbrau1/15428/Bobra.43_2s0054.1